MKNIHILPTDKPSRLVKQKYHKGLYLADMITKKAEYKRFNIYIISDETINTDDWFLNIHQLVPDEYGNGIYQHNIKGYTIKDYHKKIILTTDQDLIGVQAIDDEFLEFIVNNPSCEEVEIEEIHYSDTDRYEIIIPKEEPKTFKELFANTGIEPTTDESGNIQYNFKATMKEGIDFGKELSKWGYNKGNSIDVEILVNEILPDLFKQFNK